MSDADRLKQITELQDLLAAANARIAELEEGKDGPYACCACCPDDDPEYHAENPPNSHSTWCKSCGTPTAVAERDRLQARIDKALARLADATDYSCKNEWDQRQRDEMIAEVTAALSDTTGPEGKPYDGKLHDDNMRALAEHAAARKAAESGDSDE